MPDPPRTQEKNYGLFGKGEIHIRRRDRLSASSLLTEEGKGADHDRRWKGIEPSLTDTR